MTTSEHDLPLAGIRVIDVATFIAAPYAASILGEFGAEVIKVEHPIGGDPCRRFGTPTSREDCSLAWLSEARGKKSVTIDLHSASGADLFRRLVREADVVCENFRPGTMEKWGLGWEVLSADNPRLIMLRVSGYGQTGPYRDRPGFARIAHAVGGLSYLAGMPRETPVTPGSTTLGDYLSGAFGAIGLLLALRHRDRTGEGQMIDVGLYESVFRMTDELAPAYGMYGTVRERYGPHITVSCPLGHFRTKDDRWIAIACTTDKLFDRLARAMGRPELASSSVYGLQAQRLAQRYEVNDLVANWAGSLTRDQIMHRCLEVDAPVVPLNDIADIFADRHFRARNNLIAIDDGKTGETMIIPTPMPRMSETPGRIASLGPGLGEHTDEVLSGLLGLSDEELADLRARRVI